MGDMLQALPEKERGQAIAIISKTLGKNAARGMATQLDKKDRAMAIAFASGNSELARRVIDGQAALGGDKKINSSLTDESGKPKLTLYPQIAKEMDGMFANPETVKVNTDAAYLASISMAKERGNMPGSNMMEKAIRLAVGGEIVEQGQGRIVIPEGRTQRELNQRLKSYKPEDIAKQSPDGKVRVGGMEMDAAALVERLPGATLQTLAPGRYVILAPRVQGGKPDTYVTGSGGKPIVVGFE